MRMSQSCFSWYATCPTSGQWIWIDSSLSPALAGMRLVLSIGEFEHLFWPSQSCFSWYATCPSTNLISFAPFGSQSCFSWYATCPSDSEVSHSPLRSQSCFSWYATCPKTKSHGKHSKSLSPALAGMRLVLSLFLILRTLKSLSPALAGMRLVPAL